MKDKTKKILLAIGGIGAGVVVLSTGGALFGMATVGILARAGTLKGFAELGPVSKETAKILFSKGYIAGKFVQGAVCSAVGIKMGYDSGKALGEALNKSDTED